MKYIVFDNQMFCYELSDYGTDQDIASLTIDKNPDDVRLNRVLRTDWVENWSSYVSPAM